MEILDWLLAQNTAETRIAYDEIALLRQKVAERDAVIAKKDEMIQDAIEYGQEKPLHEALVLTPSSNVLDEYLVVGLHSQAKVKRDKHGEMVIYDDEKPALNIVEKKDK
jgi:hypothetical protein